MPEREFPLAVAIDPDTRRLMEADTTVIHQALRYVGSERLTDLCNTLQMTTREAEAFRQRCVELYISQPSVG